MRYSHVGEVIHGPEHARLDIWDLHSLQATADQNNQVLVFTPVYQGPLVISLTSVWSPSTSTEPQ